APRPGNLPGHPGAERQAERRRDRHRWHGQEQHRPLRQREHRRALRRGLRAVEAGVREVPGREDVQGLPRDARRDAADRRGGDRDAGPQPRRDRDGLHVAQEARLRPEAARKYGVATQMGNQGHSGESTRLMCEWVWDGAIGHVREAHGWTNRPVWPQGVEMDRPSETVATPTGLDWDLWIGPAAYRPFNPTYHPAKWRAWWDFGTGSLGDMGCHIIDPLFWAL